MSLLSQSKILTLNALLLSTLLYGNINITQHFSEPQKYYDLRLAAQLVTQKLLKWVLEQPIRSEYNINIWTLIKHCWQETSGDAHSMTTTPFTPFFFLFYLTIELTLPIHYSCLRQAWSFTATDILLNKCHFETALSLFINRGLYSKIQLNLTITKSHQKKKKIMFNVHYKHTSVIHWHLQGKVPSFLHIHIHYIKVQL